MTENDLAYLRALVGIPAEGPTAEQRERWRREETSPRSATERRNDLLARRRAARVLVDGALVATDPRLTHGQTRNAYVNWGCRCAPCCRVESEANARKWARYSERKRDTASQNAA